jgi:hypothetical protein
LDKISSLENLRPIEKSKTRRHFAGFKTPLGQQKFPPFFRRGKDFLNSAANIPTKKVTAEPSFSTG